jgi:hypothetical protein
VHITLYSCLVGLVLEEEVLFQFEGPAPKHRLGIDSGF